MSDTFHSPKGTPVAVLALAVFLAWLPAQAGQPSLVRKVLHIDVRGLDLLLQSDPNLLLMEITILTRNSSTTAWAAEICEYPGYGRPVRHIS